MTLSNTSPFSHLRTLALRKFSPEYYQKEQNRWVQSQWREVTFNFVNRLDAFGGYKVMERFGGIATVVDHNEFMQYDHYDDEIRNAFNCEIVDFFHKTAESLGYEYVYLPWALPDTGLYQPSIPLYYRFEKDAGGKIIRIWRDLNRRGLVEAVLERIPLIHGCKVHLINHYVEPAGGHMAEANYQQIPEQFLNRIQAEPEYLEYISALAVSMNKRAQKLITALDEQLYESKLQPLKIYVRRIRESEEVTIRWEIKNQDTVSVTPGTPEWFNALRDLKLFVVRYRQEVPLRSREFPEDGQKILSGTDQLTGQVSIKLKPGLTAYFGAWVEGVIRTGTKGFFHPINTYSPWWPEHAITFNVYMPEQNDVLSDLNREYDVEKAKKTLRDLRHPPLPTAKESPAAIEMRRDYQARFLTKLQLDEIANLRKEFNNLVIEARKQVEAGEMSFEDGEAYIKDAEDAYSNLIDNIHGRMTGGGRL